MSELVRVSLNHTDNGQINWPNRCPRCGSSERLIYVEGRVGAELKEGAFSFSVVTTLMRMQTEVTTFRFPVCREHAFSNEVGIRLLEKALPLNLLRGLIYLAFYLFCDTTVRILMGDSARWLRLRHDFVFDGFMLFGLLGMITLLWARRAAATRPMKLDMDSSIVTIRFRDAQYARDFKRANAKATHRLSTAGRVFFLRPAFWKWVFGLGLAFFIYQVSIKG